MNARAGERTSHESSPPASRSRAYWICQLLGWGGYGLGYYLAVLVPFNQHGIGQILVDTAFCAAGLIGTHLLRMRMKSRGWSEYPLSQLVPRLLAASLVVGLFPTVVLFGLLNAGSAFTWATLRQSFGVFGSIYFFTAFLVVLWEAIYLAVQAIRRRRMAELNALKAEVLAREAKLKNLQQQLNPHFLFNCLNSLRGMIDEDRARAQEMVTRLAELLRYSLRADDCSSVSLEEELATVDAYLDLESVRFEERLSIRREISSEARQALLPPMLLQGLVENALKHGIAHLSEGGNLTLRIGKDADMLRLEVENSGTLRQNNGSGIGLANARERLQILYGQRASLTLTEEPPGRVRAVAIIPFEQTEALCEPSS
jgi:sensor histidine kinase YesM